MHDTYYSNFCKFFVGPLSEFSINQRQKAPGLILSRKTLRHSSSHLSLALAHPQPFALEAFPLRVLRILLFVLLVFSSYVCLFPLSLLVFLALGTYDVHVAFSSYALVRLRGVSWLCFLRFF